jgi:hypothetical protein
MSHQTHPIECLMRFSAMRLAFFLLLAGCVKAPPGSPDGGGPSDAGNVNDAGDDAGADDAGAVDGGPAGDAGVADAGVGDAGVGDAGGGDAGVEDAGPAPICHDEGQHNGGDGLCVPLGACSAGYFITEDGRCTAWQEAPELPTSAGGVVHVAIDNFIFSVCGAGSEDLRAELVDGRLSEWTRLPHAGCGSHADHATRRT